MKREKKNKKEKEYEKWFMRLSTQTTFTAATDREIYNTFSSVASSSTPPCAKSERRKQKI